ncbi:hypothetical protein BCR42DRAFT_466428 [Absidia repens]|uniref:Uncharacterized protein n=1 Tax=Absidia repens TaxID=90262 RepID=A0A1X2IF99_9FUNG|nr:hypothetical protein BCR42DRAFT_466428 [Absidia repens]
MVRTSFLLFLAFSTVMIHGAPLKTRSTEHDLTQEKANVVPPNVSSQSAADDTSIDDDSDYFILPQAAPPCDPKLQPCPTQQQSNPPPVANCMSNTANPQTPNPVKAQNGPILGL